jgi:hypothetical protein
MPHALATPPSVASSPSLVTRLETQWREITCSPAAVRRAQLWFPDCAGLSSLDEVLTSVGFHGRRDDADSDARLLHLVTWARDDELAARVVLQRILPGLLSIAMRRTRYCRHRLHETFSELATAAWLLVRTYPVERRPIKVAANLLRDAEYEVFVRHARRMATRTERTTAWVPDTPVAEDEHAGTCVVEVLRLGREWGMPDHDLRLLAELASGRHPDVIAASLGCSARTVRNRRNVLARALRTALVEGIVDWPAPAPRFYDRWEVRARWTAVRAGRLTA